MLPKEHRLRNSDDFRRVYRSGRSYGHPLLTLHILHRHEGSRWGISVGKKTGNAVVRNLVRRRLRAILSQEFPRWKVGLDGVLTVKPAAATADYGALHAAVMAVAKRAGVILAPTTAIPSGKDNQTAESCP